MINVLLDRGFLIIPFYYLLISCCCKFPALLFCDRSSSTVAVWTVSGVFVCGTKLFMKHVKREERHREAEQITCSNCLWLIPWRLPSRFFYSRIKTFCLWISQTCCSRQCDKLASLVSFVCPARSPNSHKDAKQRLTNLTHAPDAQKKKNVWHGSKLKKKKSLLSYTFSLLLQCGAS